MKIQTDTNQIIITGEINPQSGIIIYAEKIGGNDYYSISLLKNGLEIDCLPSLKINKKNVICRNNSLKIGKQVL